MMQTTIDARRSLLLVVDVQARLAPAIDEGAAAVENNRRLLQAAPRLQVPVLVTEHYPQGLDAAFAAETMFKERIAHGMFSGALISAAIACRLPGPGTIYLGQQLKFTRPVKLGDTLTVQLEVLEKLPKGRVRLATRVFNQNQEQVVDGEAEVLAPRAEQTLNMPEIPKVTVG